MTRRIAIVLGAMLAVAGAALGVLTSIHARPSADARAAHRCKALLALSDTDLSVLTAELVPATTLLPEHCRVTGLIPPTVGFEVRLPTDWNGKFYMVGNGGYLGRIFDQSYGLARGYATASTDTGHIGPSPRFGLDRQREIDFAFRAVHVSVLAAKRLIAARYGEGPKLSYYRGCSTGGRQGLMELQRFPADFDGASITAPIYDYTLKQTYNAAWVAQALFGNNRAGYVPPRKLEALGKAVYARCDGLDGLQDGLIDDPRRCDFDPAKQLKRCVPGGDGPDCFTSAQIAAIAKIYDGPGNGIYPGHVKGAEWMAHRGPGFSGGWDLYFIGKMAAPGEKTPSGAQGGTGGRDDAYGGDVFKPVQLRNAMSFFRYLAFDPDRPDFNALTDLDFDHLPDTSAMAAIMNATDPDLTPFYAHGGKLILSHGWADVGLNPLATVKYYEAIGRAMGKDVRGQFVRLFMVPGMYHCSGGPGPDLYRDLEALETWVEQGRAPETMIAYKVENADQYNARERTGLRAGARVIRSRPLCAYPKVARYQGHGSLDEASNFACVAPPAS